MPWGLHALSDRDSIQVQNSEHAVVDRTFAAAGLWSVKLFPAAHEAVIARVGVVQQPAKQLVVPDPPDERAVRRSRTAARRYGVANSLGLLVTLTFASAIRDRGPVLVHVRRFLGRLRRGGEAFPWLFTTELHDGGHGWHLHLALPPIVTEAEVRAVWPHGFVNVRDHGSSVGGLREVAGYVTKSFGELRAVVGRGRHLYEVAQRFQPQRVVYRAGSRETAENWLREAVGEEALNNEWKPEAGAGLFSVYMWGA
jgi:hypothetical protein